MENNLVLTNADIITMNPHQHRAQAVAVKKGRIVALGSREDDRPYIDESPSFDLKGKTVLPA